MAISNIYVTAKISMTSLITRVFWIEIQLFISSIWNYILILSGFPQCPKKVLSCPIILMHMHFCVCACKYVWEKQYVMVLERKCFLYIYILFANLSRSECYFCTTVKWAYHQFTATDDYATDWKPGLTTDRLLNLYLHNQLWVTRSEL